MAAKKKKVGMIQRFFEIFFWDGGIGRLAMEKTEEEIKLGREIFGLHIVLSMCEDELQREDITPEDREYFEDSIRFLRRRIRKKERKKWQIKRDLKRLGYA